MKYSDKDILTIINFPCHCHPYCGSRCDKCNKWDSVINSQVDDLRRLLKAGKIRLTRGGDCPVEVVDEYSIS